MNRIKFVFAIVPGIVLKILRTALSPILTLICMAGPLTAEITATASSADTQVGPPSNSVDHDISTRWSSAFQDNQWIIFDLGRKTDIPGIQIFWETAHAKEYRILGSDDKEHWKQLRVITNSYGGEELADLVNASCRYLKLDLIKRATEWGFSIYEIKFLNRAEFKEALLKSRPPEGMFEFHIPEDDTVPVFFDLSRLNDKPAGKSGHVTAGPDGHFYTGGKRIKFVGVNMLGLPSREMAEKTAKHLAKFGVNIVRFHMMDWYVIDWDTGNTRHLRKDKLDDFDYFVSKLKENGIYCNINLLCGRNFMVSDGLPGSIKDIEWKQQGSIATIDKKMIELQKEYAKNLLDRVNPYTGLSYLDDPAVASVEINNENGVLISWIWGTFDRLPEVFTSDLKNEWNEYLLKKYKTPDDLKRAWSMEKPLGGEMLKNGDFTGGTENWIMEQHGNARSTSTVDSTDGKYAAKIEVLAAGDLYWHIQFNQMNLELKKDAIYTVSFRAKADKDQTITAAFNQAHDPWDGLGFQQDMELTKDWKEFKYIFMPSKSDSNARLSFFNMCKNTGTYWFTDVSLKPGGKTDIAFADSLKSKTMPIIKKADINNFMPPTIKDWVEFLSMKERQYWGGMADYLKKELKGQFLVCGTIVGCSTPNIMNGLDYIDGHAYWQHPQFHKMAWSRTDWSVGNNSLLDEPPGYPVSYLASKKVSGKPFTVSEYDHPSPNVYAAEAYLVLGTYSAYQDWDSYSAFCYSPLSTEWISSYFDLWQHTSKFVNFLAAACLFRRGDLSPAGRTAYVNMGNKDESEVIPYKSSDWNIADAGSMGMKNETAYSYKTCIVPEGGYAEKDWIRPEQTETQANGVYNSDTGEIQWDTRNGIFKVNSPLSKILAGFVTDKDFDLAGIIIHPRKNKLDWCTMTLTAFGTDDFSKPPLKILMTATGAVMNTGMKYTIYPDKPVDFPPPKNAMITVGEDWGHPPLLAEGIGAGITLPYPHDRVKVFALDMTGQRNKEVPVIQEGDKSRLEISGEYRTLWYEIEVQ